MSDYFFRQKLGKDENNKYRNFKLLRETVDISFEETANIWSNIFGQERGLLFHTLYKCLNILKGDYAVKVNRNFEIFCCMN